MSHAYVKLPSLPVSEHTSEYENADSGFLGSASCKSPIDQSCSSFSACGVKEGKPTDSWPVISHAVYMLEPLKNARTG